MQQSPKNPVLGRIRVSGADAEPFLQGQLTQDIRSLEDRPLWAGYCSAKGRLLAVMTLIRSEGGIDLELHHDVLNATLKRLKMFVLRSKVTLDELPALIANDEGAWKRQNITDGLPVIYPDTSDHFVPQMVNLDQLGGISFSKGCYTGQEIVARLHYLGNLKRRMFLLHSAAPAPAPGTQIYDGSGAQAVGEVVDSVDESGGSLLNAVLQLGSAHSSGLRLGDAGDGAALSAAVAYRYAAAPA